MSPDVVVAGAGPAGSVTAGLLARSGVEVWLCDAEFDASRARPRIGESLPPAARPLLASLGLEQIVGGVALPGNGTLSAWGSDSLAVTDSLFQPHGAGWTLDRDAFDACLREWASACGARFVAGRAKAREISLRDGSTVQARVTVDATGRAASVGARRSRRIYHDALTAFHARFHATRNGDADSRVLVESVIDGWWYTVRVPSGERVVAFLTDSDLPSRAGGRALASLAETRFVREALAAFDYRPIHCVRGADARTSRLEIVAGSEWVAVGDAAFSVDPLSSQGIVDALLTAKLAAPIVTRLLAGDCSAAAEYCRQIDALYERYLVLQRDAYSRERRWFAEPFWARRIGK